MKKLLACVLIAVFSATLTAGCVTQARQNLYDEGGDTAKRLADVLGRWQATTLDNALASANDGLKLWTEKRGAYVVERTTAGKLDDPVTIRTIAWYDNVLRSVGADIAFINALKAKAAAVKPS